MEIVAGEIDLRIGYFYLNAIFTVVGRKRNAFTVIKCDIVVDNIATDLRSELLNFNPPVISPIPKWLWWKYRLSPNPLKSKA